MLLFFLSAALSLHNGEWNLDPVLPCAQQQQDHTTERQVRTQQLASSAFCLGMSGLLTPVHLLSLRYSAGAAHQHFPSSTLWQPLLAFDCCVCPLQACKSESLVDYTEMQCILEACTESGADSIHVPLACCSVLWHHFECHNTKDVTDFRQTCSSFHQELSAAC